MKKNKALSMESKRQRKAHKMEHPGEKSNYHKKREYLHIHGGMGFDYPDKPWR